MNQEEVSRKSSVAEDLLARARSSNQCQAALEELRTLRVSEPALEALREHAALRSSDAGCAAMYLAARAIYVEQLKAHLDLEIEGEVEEFERQFKGSAEADLVRHALTTVSDYSDESALASSAAFFKKQADADEEGRLPHFRALAVLSQQRVNALRTAPRATLQEAQAIGTPTFRSVVFQRLSARYGLRR